MITTCESPEISSGVWDTLAGREFPFCHKSNNCFFCFLNSCSSWPFWLIQPLRCALLDVTSAQGCSGFYGFTASPWSCSLQTSTCMPTSAKAKNWSKWSTRSFQQCKHKLRLIVGVKTCKTHHGRKSKTAKSPGGILRISSLWNDRRDFLGGGGGGSIPGICWVGLAFFWREG